MKLVRQIESLYRKDAEQQVQAAQRNALVDYKELGRMQQENERLMDFNEHLSAMIRDFFDQMAEPEVRERIFAIADALIGGQPMPASSGGGGGSSSADNNWGRDKDENDLRWARRCAKAAAQKLGKQPKLGLQR